MLVGQEALLAERKEKVKWKAQAISLGRDAASAVDAKVALQKQVGVLRGCVRALQAGRDGGRCAPGLLRVHWDFS